MKKNPSVKKPVFIIGCPRSGTSVFESMVGLHPELCWPSVYTKTFPNFPQLSVLSRIHDCNALGTWMKNHYYLKLVPSPYEVFRLFNAIDPNFRITDRTDPRYPKSVAPGDLTGKEKDKLRQVVRAHIKFQGKERFLSKITGKPRIVYLDSVFPDSIFVHILRKGKPVVNSIKNRLGEGWFPKGERKVWKDYWPEKWRDRINKSENPDVVFLAYFYKDILRRIKKQSATLEKHRFLTVTYRDFVKAPLKILKLVYSFVGVSWDKEHAKWVKRQPLSNRNFKWKKQLSRKEIEKIDDVFQDMPKFKISRRSL